MIIKVTHLYKCSNCTAELPCKFSVTDTNARAIWDPPQSCPYGRMAHWIDVTDKVKGIDEWLWLQGGD